MSVPQPSSVSASPPNGSKPSTSGPKWDPRFKYFQTRLRFGLLLALVAAITLGVIYWVATQNITQAEVKSLAVGANLTLILAPVLAASAGVERFLETIFTIVEGNARTLVAYLGRGMRWLHNAESEVDNARQWLANVSAEYNRQLKELPFSGMTPVVSMRIPEATSAPTGTPGQPATASLDSQQIFALADTRLKSAQELMNLAIKRLQLAEDQLSDATASDSYRNAKRAACIYLGLLLGLVVATASSLQMFALMGVKVGDPRIDVIVTGLVIGSGSAPVHSLINILQSAKDTLDSAQGWLDSAKKKPATQEQGS
jgi:hypothetical protein